MLKNKSVKVDLHLDSGEIFYKLKLPQKQYDKIEKIVERDNKYENVEHFCCYAIHDLVREEEKTRILDDKAIEALKKALFPQSEGWEDIDPAYHGM